MHYASGFIHQSPREGEGEKKERKRERRGLRWKGEGKENGKGGETQGREG